MAKRILNPIAAYEAEMQMASRPPGATQAEQAASVRALLYAHFRKSNSFGSLQHMAGVIEQITPDLKHAPGACNPGLKAFYNFDAPLSNANASQVAVEIKARHRSMPDIDVCLIQAVHGILCQDLSNGESTYKRGNLLPYRGISFFLETCAASYLSAVDLTLANSGRSSLQLIVHVALEAVEVHNRYTETST